LHAIKNTGLTVLNSTGFELQESQLIRVFYIDTETFRQLASDGTPFIEMLVEKDIIPGIKVDKGTTALAGFTGEKITEGLDGLRIHLMEYREMGARFAKWRAVIKIGQGIPTAYCIKANAHALARYAALCQQVRPGAHRRTGSVNGRRSQHQSMQRSHRGHLESGVF
jgi:fructose-bisphosphate aldolase class 1